MSAETRHGLKHTFGQKRSQFREWRGQRPFWGGLLTLLAGIPIMWIPYQNITLGSLTIRMSTTAGAGSLIIGVLLVVLGLTMWFQPSSRVFAGIAAILLSLVSLVVSNVGAFLIGFLLGLLGGALGVAWAPAKPSEAGAAGDAGGEDEPERAPSSPTYSSDPAPGLPKRTPGETTTGGGGGAGRNTGTGGALDDLSVFGSASTTGADANHGNGRHRAG
ncbi:DUF6114 domain-containing protein [Streptomyces sp. ODS28]|uniref:DUF6114 domain-containing protein n=1 Tax=Streptomyces sp. ODS28 TaxID=3136688 RepID=UPI0031E5E6D0